MNLGVIIEVAIGLVLTWLILSMTVMQFQEIILNMLGTRSKFMEDRLREMFKNEDLKEQFYNHPMIQALKVKNWGRTDKAVNIPNPVFAKAAVDIFLNAGKTGDEVPAGTMNLAAMKKSMTESMSKLKDMDPDLERTVKFLAPNLDVEGKTGKIEDKAKETITKVEKSLAEFRGNVESWFDNTMVEATAMYRKKARTIALWLGFLVALVFNVDSIYIVKQLWLQPTLREAIVAQAQNIQPGDSTSSNAIDILAKDKLQLPIGWTHQNKPAADDYGAMGVKFLGFLISGSAASLGAPFWFDILSKLFGLKRATESKTASKEREKE